MNGIKAAWAAKKGSIETWRGRSVEEYKIWRWQRQKKD